MKIMLMLILSAGPSHAGPWEDAQALLAQRERGAGRAALEACLRDVESYRSALQRHADRIAKLADEAATRTAFPDDWGADAFEAAAEDLEANLTPPSGMRDANVLERPLPAWWNVWDAVRAKDAGKDESFRLQATLTAAALRLAVSDAETLGQESLRLYGVLVRKGANAGPFYSSEEFFLNRVDYRRKDLSRMLKTVAELAQGRRPRMKDPSDW